MPSIKRGGLLQMTANTTAVLKEGTMIKAFVRGGLDRRGSGWGDVCWANSTASCGHTAAGQKTSGPIVGGLRQWRRCASRRLRTYDHRRRRSSVNKGWWAPVSGQHIHADADCQGRTCGPISENLSTWGKKEEERES